MATGAVGEESNKAMWLLALLAAGAGTGALMRYPHLTSASGLTFFILVALGLAVLGLPLLLGEAALGQFRRRNAVDAMGPGLWRASGFVLALGALLTAALLAVVAGWAGRYVVDSFQGGYFDDPDRHFRLISAGSDALLGTLLAMAAATGGAMIGARKGLRATVAVVAVGILIVVGGLAAWASIQTGATAGRNDFFTVAWDDINAAMIVEASLQALLPALVGLGLVATVSNHVHDRTLPRDATLLVTLLALVPLGVGLFVTSLASANSHELSGDGGAFGVFGDIPRLFATLPDTEGGVLSGLFFTAVLSAALVALVALLEVPATWLRENFAEFTAPRAFLATGLVTYIVAVPFCFGVGLVTGLHLFLAGVLAPLGGLILAVHVGWVRPQVLDGFRVGEAKHQLDAFLRPQLRFVAPALLLVLLVAGSLAWLVDIDAVARGSGGLWRLVP